MQERIQALIETLKLIPHPEGGWYKETYRSDLTVEGEAVESRYGGKRNAATSIYFLLVEGTFSAFHQIVSDEQWHFYEGDPVEIHVIDSLCQHQIHLLGPLNESSSPQLLVNGGDLFGSRVVKGYALVGCTVAPGFDFNDFEMPAQEVLLEQYPEHQQIIRELSR